MEATMNKEEKSRPKRGLRSLFRRNKKEGTATPEKDDREDEETATPPMTPEVKEKSERKAVTSDGIPVVSVGNADDFVPSDVRQTVPGGPTVTKSAKKGRRRGGRETIILDAPPPAREAAFSGPPRYDWIDIETAAAIKVQAAYRRNKVMAELESQGISTAATRNRARRRNARQRLAASEDTPSIFRCCGVGLLFGDSTEEDEAAAAAHRKELYEEKKRQKAEREEQLRKFHPRKKASDNLVESLEVTVEEEAVE